MTQAAINQAKVLYGLCQDRSVIKNLESMYTATPALEQVLNSPVVPLVKKFNIIEEISNRTNQPEIIKNYLKTICRNDEIDEVKDAITYFYQMCDKAENIIRSEAVFASEPSEEKKAEIVSFLQSKYPGQKIDLSIQVDPEILGGVLVRVGNTEYDHSYDGCLKQLERKLT